MKGAATLPAGLIVQPYDVAVSGYGTDTYFAASRSKALAIAWRRADYLDLSFMEFMRRASARKAACTWERFGEAITVAGTPAFLISANKQYVQFVRPCSDVILNAHPFDVVDGSGQDWPYWAARPGRAPSKRPYRILDAVASRISRQGDMPIRVHRNTIAAIFKALGLQWELGEDSFREIDALALDALRHLASKAIAA